MAISIGDKAPEFALYNSDKKKISLSDQKGKNVLLLFFPLAFTSVCTAELCGVRDNLAAYTAVNAIIFGISVDSTYTLAKFKEEQQLNFDLLSDFNKEASAKYEAIYENFGLEMHGVSKRAAFVIDKDGIVQYVEVLNNAKEVPDFGKINETLSKLI